MSDFSPPPSSVLDALPFAAAVIATNGEILLINRAWRAFADANRADIQSPRVGVGENYLLVSDGAHGPFSEGAAEAAAGIRAVLSGALPEFELEYPCHSPRQQRWFRLHVAPYEQRPARALVTHQEITTLREVRARLRAVLDSSEDLIFFKDLNGVYRGCNAAVGRLLGRPLREIVGRTDAELFSNAKAKGHAAVDREILASGDAQRLDIWHTYPDGRRALFETLKTPLLDSDGIPIGVLGIGREVTEERQAQQRLAESEARYRMLFELTDDALWLLSDELGVNQPNLATARLFGYDAIEAMAGKLPQDLSPPEQPDGTPSDEALARFKAAIRAHGVGRTEWAHERADGTAVLAEIRAQKVPFGDHHVVLARLRDLTEHRRRAERERLADAVFRATSEGITITDQDARIVAVNPAFTKITGYCADEVIGENPRILQSGRHDRAFYDAMWAALSDPERGSWQGELWNRRKDGQAYPEWISINAIRDSEGRLSNYVAVFSDMAQLRRSAEEIERLSNRDPLTDLLNERSLRTRLSQALRDKVTEERALAVFTVDIDHFKRLVVAEGQDIGDTVLRQTAERLRALHPPESLIARVSDDTFVVAAWLEKGPSQAASMAERYRSALAEPLSMDEGKPLTLSVSVGIALFPNDGHDASRLLRHAAAALLQAKLGGGGKIALYRPEFTAAANERLQLEDALRRALANDEFELLYQPVVDAGTGVIVGAEALLRWRRDGELVSPAAFIDVVEGSDLVHPVGRWVIEQAVRQLAQWHAERLCPIFVSVNVAEAQITRGGLAAFVSGLLSAHRVAPTLLQVEVLERVLLADPERARQELEEIRALGCRVALDDFGTGYSSLAYLTRFEVDTLKIDRSFVSQLGTETGAAAIVRATLPMARSLEITTVAEGVEHDSERQFLLEHGCDVIQGYLASRPLPAAAVTELLHRNKPLLPPRDPHGAPERRLLLLVGHSESREALRQWLADQGWEVFAPESMEAAADLIASRNIGVALIEEDAPGESGVAAAERLRSLYPNLVRVFSTRRGRAEVLVDAVNRGGVSKVLTEPFEVIELRRTLERALDEARALRNAERRAPDSENE